VPPDHVGELGSALREPSPAARAPRGRPWQLRAELTAEAVLDNMRRQREKSEEKGD
jgi:hypothetical protein